VGQWQVRIDEGGVKPVADTGVEDPDAEDTDKSPDGKNSWVHLGDDEELIGLKARSLVVSRSPSCSWMYGLQVITTARSRADSTDRYDLGDFGEFGETSVELTVGMAPKGFVLRDPVVWTNRLPDGPGLVTAIGFTCVPAPGAITGTWGCAWHAAAVRA
jgi:hypothetical protein